MVLAIANRQNLADQAQQALDLEDAKHEHPEWVKRLQREGRLEEALATPPPVPLRILYFLFGYAIIALGLFLLVFAIANATLLTLF